MINPVFAVDLKKERMSEQNETQSLVMAQRQFLSSSPEKEKRWRVRKDTAISGLDGGEK